MEVTDGGNVTGVLCIPPVTVTYLPIVVTPLPVRYRYRYPLPSTIRKTAETAPGRAHTLRRARLDGMGLVPLLGGRPVIALTEDAVGIRAGSGGTQTFRRHRSPPPGRCLVWELECPS